MDKLFSTFEKLGILLIVEGKFCFNTTDPMLHLQFVMKNDLSQSKRGGRLRHLGMGGIGNITTLALSLRFLPLRLRRRGGRSLTGRTPICFGRWMQQNGKCSRQS